MKRFPNSLVLHALMIILAPSFFSVCAAEKEATSEGNPILAVVDSLIEAGSYAVAEETARGLLAEIEVEYGSASLEAAEVLDALVECLRRGGKAAEPESRALAERAVSAKEQLLGTDHPDVAASLGQLAGLLWQSGNYEEARSLCERALAIQTAAFGPNNPRVASSMNNLAVLLWKLGEYEAARQLYERALAVKENLLGPSHPDLALSMNNLAGLLDVLGDYERSQELYERALAIRVAALGVEHPQVAETVSNLATLHWKRGEYESAEELHKRALSIWQQALGADHPLVAVGLNNLALLRSDLGDSEEARRLYERALAIQQRALGPSHPDVAATSNNLALVHSDLGDSEAARGLCERALAIREEALGPAHQDVATSLHNLADLLVTSGDFDSARIACERALAIKVGAVGPDHPTVATSLSTLALLLREAGDCDSACSLYRRAVSVRESALGADHPDLAYPLTGLADTYRLLGDHGAAGRAYERAVRICEAALGDGHPRTAGTRARLAGLLLETGRVPEALECALEAEDAGREHLRLMARTMSERQALQYSAERTSGLDLALTLAAKGMDPANVERIWDAQIRARALVLDEMAARHRTVHGAEEIARLGADLASVRQRLALLTVRGPGNDPRGHYRSLLSEVRREKEAAERALAEESAQYQEELKRSRLGYRDVARALPSGSALVAFSSYGLQESAPRTIESYVALVLTDEEKTPVAVPLGSSAEIDSLIEQWRQELSRGVKGLGSRSSKERSYRQVGEALRNRIWDPLEKHISDASEVFLVPDGALNLVSFAALPAGAGSYVLEQDPRIHYLSAERDLIQVGAGVVAGSGLLVVGGPDYDAPLSGTVPIRANQRELVSEELLRGGRARCDGFESLHFPPLPATVREIDEAISLWESRDAHWGRPLHDDLNSTLRLTGAGATEAAVRSSSVGKRILHLATHGFFLGGNCPSPADDESEDPAVRHTSSLGSGSPLLRAGLALAGANRRREAVPGQDDGILTAEEISALDLAGVEWAVLSACETGVGEVEAGEGVFGLRRAFQVAGVRTVIMSLWEVEDQAARVWVRMLYRGRFEKRFNTAEAVHRACLDMLEGRRRNGESTHPFYWGAFIAVGDWR